MSSSKHLLDIPYGEQAWLKGDKKPFFFHQTRGAWRPSDKMDEWMREAGKYLKEK